MSRAETLVGLAEAIAGHAPVIRADRIGSPVGCQCMDRVFYKGETFAAHVATVALAWLEGRGWGPRGSQANRALLDESWAPVETGEGA